MGIYVVWGYTNISNRHICYWWIHVLYGGHRGVAVYMYKLEYAYTLTTRVYVYIFFGGYLAYPVVTGVSQYTCIG